MYLSERVLSPKCVARDGTEKGGRRTYIMPGVASRIETVGSAHTSQICSHWLQCSPAWSSILVPKYVANRRFDSTDSRPARSVEQVNQI